MKEVIIKGRRHSFSLFSGHTFSKKHSEGLNFKELREYQVGDNVKRLDHKTTAKLGKPFVKVFEDDKELNIVISIILDAKSFFGSKKLKSELVLEITSLLGFSAMKGGDRVSFLIFCGKEVYSVKPSKNHASIKKALDQIDALTLIGKKTDFESVITHLLAKVPKNSVLIMLGDFFYKSDKLKLLGKKCDTYAVVVRDYLEENPQKLNAFDLVSPLSKKPFRANFQNAFLKRMRAHDAEMEATFKQSGIASMKLYTHEELLKLRNLFG